MKLETLEDSFSAVTVPILQANARFFSAVFNSTRLSHNLAEFFEKFLQ